MDKRILVMSGYSRGPDEKDNLMGKVFELTLPSKQRYVKKHGYDLLVNYSFGSEKQFGFEERHIGIMRMYNAFRMLSYYDVVMWIDADAMITNENMSIHDFGLNSGHTMYLSYDWEWERTLSSGNFIIQKTDLEKINQLYSAFIEVAKHYKDDIMSEQASINYLWRTNKFSSYIKGLPHSFLNGVPRQVEDTDIWKGITGPSVGWNRPKVFCPWEENHFLAHFTGIDNTSRIDIIKKDFFSYT